MTRVFHCSNGFREGPKKIRGVAKPAAAAKK